MVNMTTYVHLAHYHATMHIFKDKLETRACGAALALGPYQYYQLGLHALSEPQSR